MKIVTLLIGVLITFNGLVYANPNVISAVTIIQTLNDEIHEKDARIKILEDTITERGNTIQRLNGIMGQSFGAALTARYQKLKEMDEHGPLIITTLMALHYFRFLFVATGLLLFGTIIIVYLYRFSCMYQQKSTTWLTPEGAWFPRPNTTFVLFSPDKIVHREIVLGIFEIIVIIISVVLFTAGGVG